MDGHQLNRFPPKGARGGLRGPEGVGEETTTYPGTLPTRGGHGVDGVRGGRYINQGAQSLPACLFCFCIMGARCVGSDLNVKFNSFF